MEPVIEHIDPESGKSRGIYAIDPDGNLITLGRTQSLKAGFRYATRGEIDGTSQAPLPQPAPSTAPVELPTPIASFSFSDSSPSDQD